jgi:hypothetical protein
MADKLKQPFSNRHDVSLWLKSASTAKGNSTKRAKAKAGEAKHSGRKAQGRLDRKARGGGKAKGYQLGGGVDPYARYTPAKHKPHRPAVSVNIAHIDNRRGIRPTRPMVPPGIAPIGPVGAPAIAAPPRFAFGGPVGGLPAQAAPRAATALAARPALPVQAQGARPFALGGGLPAQAA